MEPSADGVDAQVAQDGDPREWDAPDRAGPIFPLRTKAVPKSNELLIHEFRRIALRDPRLPATLLAPDWPGHAARSRAAMLYARVGPASEAWLDRHGLADTGPLPRPVAPRAFTGSRTISYEQKRS